MNTLVSTFKKSRIGKIPQIGLRLVNKIQEGHTSEKFWIDYIEFVRNPDNFRKLNPHSKCLLTCVVTKLQGDLFKKSRSDELIRSIYSDIINNKCISTLNLELVNMILVSSYTLRIPLSENQLDLILSRVNEDILGTFNECDEGADSEDGRQRRFPVEHSVSIIHSLSTLTRYFPRHLNRVRDSHAIKNVVSNIDLLLSFLNVREFSLILYSFDKLNLLTVDTSDKFYKFGKRFNSFDNQSLATIFYISANNVTLVHLFNYLIPTVDSMISGSMSHIRPQNGLNSSNFTKTISESTKLTGRESCNILYSLLKRNSFTGYHYKFLVEMTSKMNLQELCNISSLLLSKNFSVGDDFKSSFLNRLSELNFNDVVVLDLLTIANCFYVWAVDNDMVLDRMVSAICDNGDFIFNDKSVLLLHYLVQLKYYNLSRILKLYDLKFNPGKLNNFHHILLYNSINTLKVLLNYSKNTHDDYECEVRLKIEETVLDSILEKLQNKLVSLDYKVLTRLDLLTLGKFFNLQVLEKLIELIKLDTWNYMDVCLNMLKYNSNLKIAESVNKLISDINIDRVFIDTSHKNSTLIGHKSDEIMKFKYFLSIIVLLKNIGVLKRILNSAILAKCFDFEIILTVLNSCKKLHYFDENVEYLLKLLVKSFKGNGLFNYFPINNRSGACSGVFSTKKPLSNLTGVQLYNFKNMVSDFLNVLYHFNHNNDSCYYDSTLSSCLSSLDILNVFPLTISSDGSNSLFRVPKKNVVGYTDAGNAVIECKILNDITLFESFLVSVSNLCFNAVIHSSVLMKFIKYHIHRLNTPSPAILKCLAMNRSVLELLTLSELILINRIHLASHTHLIEDNDIHSSVLSALVNLGIKPVAEYQVLDYLIDLLIL